MRGINLREYKSREETLSRDEYNSLIEARIPDLSVVPIAGQPDIYVLTPGSTVGAVEVADLSVLITPKIGIAQVLSMACYAMGAFKPQEGLFDYPEKFALPDVLALALGKAARQAFGRGLYHGYVTQEEALLTVRGRIMFTEQIRRRFGTPLPVEVRYDEFTDDIPHNHLVKAAARRLSRIRLRSKDARVGLGWIGAMLDNVSLVEYAPRSVPEVTFNRLNEHYRTVVGLARLILQHTAFESGRGEVRASGFLMDMNVVFQEFVTTALRENLGLTQREFGEWSIDSLDTGNRVHLRPDLTWRRNGRCVFVGDAKYKDISDRRMPNADIYQLLAYSTAADLPGGLLIYAKGEGRPGTYHVRHSGTRLEVVAIDLDVPFDDVLAQVRDLAGRVKQMAQG